MDKYLEFLESKKKKAIQSGFPISDDQLNPKLKDFQRFIVKKAVEAGKYALFADTGLGKTFMQLEWARLVANKTNNPVLVLAPLAVVQQTINESIKWGIWAENYNGSSENIIQITNYDQLNNIDTSIFSGVVLDESSILKYEQGKKRDLFIYSFKITFYKLL